MTRYKKIAFAIAAGALASGPALSQQIVVKPVDSFAESVAAEIEHELDRTMRSTKWTRGGTAKVRFTAGADGEPENITLYRKSGDRSVDRVALRAVQRVDSLPRLPASLPRDQVIQANIIVANGAGHMERLQSQLAREEAYRIASADPGERTVLALNFVSSSGS